MPPLKTLLFAHETFHATILKKVKKSIFCPSFSSKRRTCRVIVQYHKTRWLTGNLGLGVSGMVNFRACGRQRCWFAHGGRGRAPCSFTGFVSVLQAFPVPLTLLYWGLVACRVHAWFVHPIGHSVSAKAEAELLHRPRGKKIRWRNDSGQRSTEFWKPLIASLLPWFFPTCFFTPGEYGNNQDNAEGNKR